VIHGDHEKWNYPDNPLDRPVIFKAVEKDIPIDHIFSNLKTLGISKKDFLDAVSKL